MNELSPNEAKVLKCLMEYIKDKGRKPSAKEIAKYIGIPKESFNRGGRQYVSGLIKNLKLKGYVVKVDTFKILKPKTWKN